MKVYVHVPIGEKLVLDTNTNRIHFENLTLKMMRTGEGSKEHLQATFLNFLIKENRLFFETEEIFSLARQLIQSFEESGFSFAEPEIFLTELVDAGYIKELKEV